MNQHHCRGDGKAILTQFVVTTAILLELELIAPYVLTVRGRIMLFPVEILSKSSYGCHYSTLKISAQNKLSSRDL